MYMEDKNIYKVVIIGDSFTGKTCLIDNYIYPENSKKGYVPTIGIDFYSKQIFDKKMQIWDTAGQERFRCVTQCYYRKADGYIICFNVTKKKSFDNVIGWYEDIMPHLADTSKILLVGTFADLKTKREVSFAEGLALSSIINAVKYIESPTDTFLEDIDDFMKIVANKQQQIEDEVISYQSTSNGKGKCCN